jgi:hypothetical protein
VKAKNKERSLQTKENERDVTTNYKAQLWIGTWTGKIIPMKDTIGIFDGV